MLFDCQRFKLEKSHLRYENDLVQVRQATSLRSLASAIPSRASQRVDSSAKSTVPEMEKLVKRLGLEMFVFVEVVVT